MRYVEFRDAIRDELSRNPAGLTWKELRARLSLPYTRPCSSWVKRLEQDISLSRARQPGPEATWKI